MAQLPEAHDPSTVHYRYGWQTRIRVVVWLTTLAACMATGVYLFWAFRSFASAPLPDAMRATAIVLVFLSPMLSLAVIFDRRRVWRLDERGVRYIQTWPRRQALRIQWCDVQRICLNGNFLRIAVDDKPVPRDIIAFDKTLQRKPRRRMIEFALQRLQMHIDIMAPSPLQLRRLRRDAWPLWRWVLDRLVLITVGTIIAGSPAMFLILSIYAGSWIAAGSLVAFFVTGMWACRWFGNDLARNCWITKRRPTQPDITRQPVPV